MPYDYLCHQCKAHMSYEGLCYRCRVKNHRNDILSLSKEEIANKVSYLETHIEDLLDLEDISTTCFNDLRGYLDYIPHSLQEKALLHNVFYPAALYYKASELIRDSLIEKLRQTEDATEGAELISCLAMQGDRQAIDTLYDFEINKRQWQDELYVPPSVYAHEAGFTFDRDKNIYSLVFAPCYNLDNLNQDDLALSPVRVFQKNEHKCKNCNQRLIDFLIVNTENEAFKEFKLKKGKLKVSACPCCVFYAGQFSKYDLDKGISEPLNENTDNLSLSNAIEDDEYEMLCTNNLGLVKTKRSMFFGTYTDDLVTIGGFANWINDCILTTCPQCKKTMQYLAQIPWDAIYKDSFVEGTLYIEICRDCNITHIQHQQT